MSAEAAQAHISRKKQTINSWKRHALCNSVLTDKSWTRHRELYGERNMVDLKL